MRSLAIILPVILRGLRERAKELKQKAASTCGNICALLDDIRDLLPLYQFLLPELNKCEEHSHPDLRNAVKAKESLLKGLDDQNSKGGKSSASYMYDALEASSVKIDPAVLTHVARVGGWMLTVAPLRMPPNILSQDEFVVNFFCILEDSLDYALAEKVAEDAVLGYKGLEASSLNDSTPKDYIVELEGIILAFAGRVLLQRTDFVLERGHTRMA